MGKRIRESEMQKIPVMLILGDKDIENQTVSVRRRTEGDLGAMSLEAALALFTQYKDA
jgi:threonyl-tRNA synthetase